MSKALDYFNGDELAASVWENKYMLPGEETPDDMHRRMAILFAEADSKYGGYNDNPNLSDYGRARKDLMEDSIYIMFKHFSYIVPQGSIMSQLGNPNSIGSLSNCFVLGQPSDSYGGICKKDEEMVHLMKRRGGVGIDLSTLRPSQTKVKNAAKTSTGAASFMHRYSNSTREVAQAGRRGALMLSMDIRHPDVMEFITAKQDLTQVTGANISVMLRDDFMEAVNNDGDYLLRFPCDTEFIGNAAQSLMNGLTEYNKLYTETNTHGPIAYYKKIKAKEYYDRIIECAWASAEPGVMFIDKHWDYSPDGVYPEYRGVTTNPCSEIFMQTYDACRLIAKNLYSFVLNPFTADAPIDYDLLYRLSYEQQWLGDLLVDLEIMHIDRIINKIMSDPEPIEIKQTELDLWINIRNVAGSGRRTGNGFTAMGDTLAALGVKYDSGEASIIIKAICQTMMSGELDATIDLAILRGPFSGCDPEMEFANGGANDFYKMLIEEFPSRVERMKKWGRRNISWSTVAPTGSVSIMTQTTSGLEPLFSPYYMRRKKINPSEVGTRIDFTDQNGDHWQEFAVVHPKFKTWWEIYQKEFMLHTPHGFVPIPNYNNKALEELSKNELDDVFCRSPWFGSTANDIDWIKRVEIQGIIQRYTTHSISSTINLPSTATVDEVSEIYKEAWKHGLKGVTVYRDGCRTGVLVVNPPDKEVKFTEHDAPKRPNSLPCKLVRFQNNYEKWVAFVGLYDDRPYEIFTGALESFPVPNNIEEGFIVKSNHPKLGKTYDFHYSCEEGECVVKGLSQAFNKEYWNYAKLISSMLRHGMPIFYVAQTIDDMSFNNDNITVWKYGVVRALKKFIANGTIVKDKCSECGEQSVIFEEGCKRCRNCGNSKCG